MLSARISGFYRQKQSANIQILSAAEDASVETFDCAIRFGQGSWEGCSAHKLFDVTVVAVGSPDLLARFERADGAGISILPLIDTKSSAGSWARWLAISGLPDAPTEGATIVTSMTDAIAAAKQGMGACLAVQELVAQELSSASLEIIWEDAHPVRSAYWFVQSERRKPSSAVKAFTKWVLTELSSPQLPSQ